MPLRVRISVLAASLLMFGASCGFVTVPFSTPTAAPRVANAAAPSRRVFAYYYLWWSLSHWHNKLGTSYPYAQRPLPLPASLDPSGCPPRSLYPGNQLTDVPAELFTQDDPAVVSRDVAQAAAAGLSGFIVNWRGTGVAGQSTQDSSLSRRLASLVTAVHQANAAGANFHLWISLQASATLLSRSAIVNDLDYLARTYAGDPAFDHANGPRIVLLWTGSRKYSLDMVRAVSTQFRSSFLLLGDENWKTWPDGRAAYLDGDSYYWSSQDPYGNPASFQQLQQLAAMVRASGPNPDGTRKLWFSPFTPGYDSILNGGSSCIPRRDGATMRTLFQGNAASNPDAWALISWNEVTEGTYVEPLQRWGGSPLATLKSLIGGP